MGFDATGDKPYSENAIDGPVWYAVIAGAMALAAGAVFLLPALLNDKGDSGIALDKLLAGRTVPEAAGIINVYGFTEPATQQFISQLQVLEPADHANLMTSLAEKALNGANRSELGRDLVAWASQYAQANAHALQQSDPVLVDQAIVLANDALFQLQALQIGLCDYSRAAAIAADPELTATLARYQTPLFEVAMRSNTLLLEMVRTGRVQNHVPPSEATLDDLEILKDSLAPLIADPNMRALFEALEQYVRGEEAQVSEGVDICQVGQQAVQRLQELPADVRARLWIAALSGKLKGLELDAKI